MGLTGKYDFKGIKDQGAKAVALALYAIPQVAVWITKLPFLKKLFDGLLQMAINYGANKGLVVFNLGAITVNGVVDQELFDRHIEDALKKVKVPGLTPVQKKAIDDDVIKAFRRFGLVTKSNSVQGNAANVGLRNNDPASRI